MRPGQLDQRVTLDRRVQSADGAGGITYSWETVAEVWANVAAKSGREGLSEGRISAEASYVFTVRHRGDVDETFRVIWGGEVYNVRAVMRTGGRPLYLGIEAERGVAN